MHGHVKKKKCRRRPYTNTVLIPPGIIRIIKPRISLASLEKEKETRNSKTHPVMC